MIKVIHAQLWSEDFSKLDKLIKDFQSCVRFAFCRFDKNKMTFNEVRQIAKIQYPTLNTTQISDAVLQGKTSHSSLLIQQKEREKDKKEIEKKLKDKKLSYKKKAKLLEKLKHINKRLKNPKLVFGGRELLNDLKSGKITKEEWISKRDNQIYGRGDKTHNGNTNIRIVSDTLRITIGFKTWESYKLFIPQKYQQQVKDLLLKGIAYNVRLIRQDENHFEVVIDYQEEAMTPTCDFYTGCLGVDCNPDRIAIADVSADGNLLSTQTIINNRLLYARTEKRDYDIGCIVKQIIDLAKLKNKGIVFEDLKFDKDKEGSTKWKRIQSNFVWKKFITLLETKCIEFGIAYRKVNPAFTSIIGKYKYRVMHKLTIHESAAYVIGRRGLGFKEKLSFYQLSSERIKSFLLRTHEEKYGKNKRISSWRLWKLLNDNVEAVLTELPISLTNLKEFVGNRWYQGEKLESEIFLRKLLAGS